MMLWLIIIVVYLDSCDTPELKAAVLGPVNDYCEMYWGPH